MLPADPEWFAVFATGALPRAAWQSGRLTSPGISRCQGTPAADPDPASDDGGGFPRWSAEEDPGGLVLGGDTGGPATAEPARKGRLVKVVGKAQVLRYNTGSAIRPKNS